MRLASLGVFLGAMYLATAHSSLPALPLHTNGRFIEGADGNRVKLACISWYGLDQKDFVVGGLQFHTLAYISASIASAGFNCVRLPWSVQLVVDNPPLQARTVSAEPLLQGKNGMDAFDATVSALTSAGLMVILDNHMSTGDWCCSTTDGNGLWYTDDYNATVWFNTWSKVAERYAAVHGVIGADLRNELRSATVGGKYLTPTWGDGNAATDWHAAATQAGEAILGIARGWLIIVEGLNYATDLQGVAQHPIVLSVPNRVVYESHNYVFDSSFSQPYDQFASGLTQNWGYIINGSNPAPIWLGECGTCHGNTTQCVSGPVGLGLWWTYLIRYLSDNDIDFSYWAWDGTQSSGTGRSWGAEETYGLVNMTWDGVASRPLLASLQSMFKA